jgi:hypothetical protein
MSSAMNAAIAELKDELTDKIEEIKGDPKMAEILRLHAALNTMEGLIGAAPTSLAAAFALESATMIVQPGEFYGMNALRAAKKFLKMKGKPGASFDEIVTGIKAGGAKLENLEKLRVSLGRSTLDVAKVGLDHYSLLEFFPHVQRGKKGKPAELGSLPIGDDDDDDTNGETDSDEALPLKPEDIKNPPESGA